MTKEKLEEYDFVIIGSGFGGSVSALRLAEKGYKVCVVEKGGRFKQDDFPNSNWNLKKWLWIPLVRFFGFFKITLFKHITVLSGVGVGGGSLVYGNCLQIPREDFFNNGSWANLSNWHSELAPYYQTAKKMLGANPNPRFDVGDKILKNISEENNFSNEIEPTDVGIYFSNNKEKCDPYFNGEGPLREPCTFCGACMIGCKFNAKNTLDKNYLYLAEKLGVKIIDNNKVIDIKLLEVDKEEKYKIVFKSSKKLFGHKKEIVSKGIIFSGGVLGTVNLLHKLKKKSLQNLSDLIGQDIRTNSESLLGVTTKDKQIDFSEGIAISSILKTDDKTSVEPVRYPAGSGFWRLMMMPAIDGGSFIIRPFKILVQLLKNPIENVKRFFVDDWAKRTQILLFMQTVNSKLKFKRNFLGFLSSSHTYGIKPSAFIKQAKSLADQFSQKSDGKTFALLSESLMGIPTTAHILGGAVMGKDKTTGVIDKNNKLFGYKNLYVCDGSMISSNPGVNPSLSICAITERAMSKIKEKTNES